MPGDEQMLQGQGAYGVRRHGPVPQAHHQDALPAPQVQKARHSLSQGLCRLRRGAAIPRYPEGLIGPLGLTQGLLPPLIQNLDLMAAYSAVLPTPGLDALQLGGLPRRLLPQVLGLLGQIRPHLHVGTSCFFS